MNSKTAIMLLEHTSYDDFNLLEHQIKSRLEAIQVLIQENTQLKEQYCERTDCGGRLGNSKKVERLIQENNQLKENLKLEKQISNGIAKDYEILLNQKKELRSWLENKLASDNYTDGVYYGFKSCLLKLNKLEGGNND